MTSYTSLRIGDLKEKRILVTGGSTGIGAAVVEALAAQGARVVAHYNQSVDEAEAIQKKYPDSIWLVRGEMGKDGEAAAVVAKAADILGGLDGLINNAGALLGRIPSTSITSDHFDRVVDLNAKSVWEASVAAHPHLKAAGGGFITNTTSVAARNGGGGGAVIYAAAKAFVSNLTRGLAKEFVNDDIRVNGVSPGLIQTPFHDRYTPPDILAAQAATIPMGRAGIPEECVGTYLFLASKTMSGYLTGQIIEVNGGQLMP